MNICRIASAVLPQYWWAQAASSTEDNCLCARFIFLLSPRVLLSQYLVGSSGLEPPTSRLSGARSNQLSYEPIDYSVVFPTGTLSALPTGGDDGIRSRRELRALVARGHNDPPDRCSVPLVLRIPTFD